MTARLTGALYTYQTHFLYVGPLIASARHKHHAGQVLWAPGGLLMANEAGETRRVVTHVVPPDTFHGHGASPWAAVLWVDRDDLAWGGLRDPWADFSMPQGVQLDAARPLSEAVERGSLRRGARAPSAADSCSGASRSGPSAALALARGLAHALLEVVAPAHNPQAYAPRHPAVKRMCALLDTSAPDREIGVTQLARQSGLSMRQLRHRFTEELGINPRAYLRWRRLRRATAAIERGATLTEAALEGGFADGAHFSRVFQAQFGMAPSQALSVVHFAGTLD